MSDDRTSTSVLDPWSISGLWVDETPIDETHLDQRDARIEALEAEVKRLQTEIVTLRGGIAAISNAAKAMEQS
jgi:cell division protein FtsB